MFRQVIHFVFLSVLFIISSCDDSSSNDRSDPPPPLPANEVTGEAYLGHLSSATIKVYDFANGKKGEEIASTQIEEGGEFDFEFEWQIAEDHPILFELSDGRYVDEYTGDEIEFKDGQKLKAIASLTSTQKLKVNITPLTTMGACLAENSWENRLGDETTDIIADIYGEIEKIYGVEDIGRAPFARVNQPIPLNMELDATIFHGYVLASFSTLAAQLFDYHTDYHGGSSPQKDYTSINVLQVMCEDLLADGKLNGIGNESRDGEYLTVGGQPLPLNFYRDFYSDSFHMLVDLDLNNSGHRREDVLDKVNHFISVSQSIIGTKPLDTVYDIHLLEDVLRLLFSNAQYALIACLEETGAIYTYEITELDCTRSKAQSILGTTNTARLDGYREEIATLTDLEYLNLSGYGMLTFDLTGLRKLNTLILDDNQIERIDNVSGSPNLKMFSILSDRGNLEQLDASKWPSLKHLSISNPRFALDISKNIRLETLNIMGDYLRNDSRFNPNSEIYELDLSNNLSIKKLMIDSANISGVNSIEEMISLEWLSLDLPFQNTEDSTLGTIQSLLLAQSNSLKHVEVRRLPDLKQFSFPLRGLTGLRIDLDNFNMSSIDLTQYPDLRELELNRLDIKEIDVDPFDKLEVLILDGINLKNSEIKNLQLAELSLHNSSLNNLDIRDLNKLTHLSLVDNASLSSLSFGVYPELQAIAIERSPLNSFGLENLSNLNTVSLLGFSDRVTLDVDSAITHLAVDSGSINIEGRIPSLLSLSLRGELEMRVDNFLTDSLDIESLVIQGSDLDHFDGSAFGELRHLDLSENQLASVELGTYWELLTLDLSDNQLSSITGGHFPDVQQIDISGNQMTEFSTDGLHYLERFSAANNRLRSFTPSRSANAKYLDLSFNQLENIRLIGGYAEIDLSHNILEDITFDLESLERINLSDNHLSEEKQQELIQLASDEEFEINLENNVPLIDDNTDTAAQM